jgi:hypothetical protein
MVSFINLLSLILLEMVGHDSVLGGGGAMFTCGELWGDCVVFDVISVIVC